MKTRSKTKITENTHVVFRGGRDSVKEIAQDDLAVFLTDDNDWINILPVLAINNPDQLKVIPGLLTVLNNLNRSGVERFRFGVWVTIAKDHVHNILFNQSALAGEPVGFEQTPFGESNIVRSYEDCEFENRHDLIQRLICLAEAIEEYSLRSEDRRQRLLRTIDIYISCCQSAKPFPEQKVLAEQFGVHESTISKDRDKMAEIYQLRCSY